jgi:hypothetical protein
VSDKKVVVEEFVVENVWTCLACKGSNRGRDLVCATCSNPRMDENEATPQEPEKAARVTDVAALAQAEAGPNVFCQKCRSQAPRGSTECGSCGSRVFGDTLPEDSGHAFIPEENRHHNLPPPPSPPVPQYVDVKGPWPFVLIGLLAIGVLTAWIVTPRTVAATVASGSWTRSIALHQRKVNHTAAWGVPLTGAAFNVQTTSKVAGYENCHPHDCNPHPVNYECNPYDCDPYQESYSCNPHDCNPHSVRYRSGSHQCNPHSERYACGTERYGCSTNCTNQKNGYSKCSTSCSEKTKYCSRTTYDSCPDYSTRTEYDRCEDSCQRTKYRTCYRTCTKTVSDTCYDQCSIIKPWSEWDSYSWPMVAHRESTGPLTASPVWPDLPAVGEEQKQEKSESYTVVFTDGKHTWTTKPASAEDFARYAPGSKWTLRIQAGTATVVGPR